MHFFVFQARALAEMGRADDALPVLRQVLDIDSPEQKDKHTFFEETVCIFISFVDNGFCKEYERGKGVEAIPYWDGIPIT